MGQAGMSSNWSRIVRYRMAETGESYCAALRAIKADPDECARLIAAEREMRKRRAYPSTERDGLDARHLLSGFETTRRRH